jgi:transglutaminase-like putative cysteine protease
MRDTVVNTKSLSPTVPSVTRCMVDLVVIKLALRVLGFRRTRKIALRTQSIPVVDTWSLVAVEPFVRQVATAAAFFPGRALCLEQSLTLVSLLRRAGIDARLRFGVQPYPFAAHAWVEYKGSPLGERGERLNRFIAFPEARA